MENIGLEYCPGIFRHFKPPKAHCSPKHAFEVILQNWQLRIKNLVRFFFSKCIQSSRLEYGQAISVS